jgi:ribosome-associated protein
MPDAPKPDRDIVPEDVPDRAERLARVCARIAWENRAEEIRLLDVRGLCGYADFFVIATGHNRQHLRAVANDVEAVMEANGYTRLGREGIQTGAWILLDYGEIILQLFEPESRTFYQIEELWADAPSLDFETPGQGDAPPEER